MDELLQKWQHSHVYHALPRLPRQPGQPARLLLVVSDVVIVIDAQNCLQIRNNLLHRFGARLPKWDDRVPGVLQLNGGLVAFFASGLWLLGLFRKVPDGQPT